MRRAAQLFGMCRYQNERASELMHRNTGNLLCTVYILNMWDEEIAPGYGSRPASLQFTSAISHGKTTDPPT